MPAHPPSSTVSKRKRKAICLPRTVEKKLVAYTVAAGGALLAIARPALAEVVYTPSNIPITPGFIGGTITQFDINNDGTPDFAFSNFSYSTHGLGSHFLKISPDQTGNQMVGVLISGELRVTAAALDVGVQVGPAANFQSYPKGLFMARVGVGSVSIQDSGSWLTVETAYLGLKFVVDGETHYGWARIKLTSPGNFASASIYGYAYESTANQPILTGQTSGSSAKTKKVSETNPAAGSGTDRGGQSLGTLAAGAPGIAMWRSKASANR